MKAYAFGLILPKRLLSGNVCDIRPCHSDEFLSKVKRPTFSVLDKTSFSGLLLKEVLLFGGYLSNRIKISFCKLSIIIYSKI